jgi:SAM-dependent methyltransferase
MEGRHDSFASLLIPATDTTLTFTGERFTPEVRGAIWYEHWHRYALVVPIATGLRVLDAACGEGYGSALLARTAASVIGLDVAPQAVAHARERYARRNVSFEVGSVASIPLPDASIDLIVSFETIEHLAEQAEMLAEFRRVLAPRGALVLSSPNRPVYNEAGGEPNHFHVRELDRQELAALLDPLFPRQAWHAQRVSAHSLLWAEGEREGAIAFDVLADDAPQRRAAPADPMYFMVVCGAADAVLPRLPALSVFDDGALSLWRDYARARDRERQLAWDELDARKIAEDRLAVLVTEVNAHASERQKTAALRERVEQLERALMQAHEHAARLQAQYDQDIGRERAQHAETRARLAYRETAAGWARWPLAIARRRLTGAA